MPGSQNAGRKDFDSQTDAELLGAARRGEEAAWRSLYERYRWFVWSVARGFYQLDYATAEDVAMSVWGKLAIYCERIREPEKLAAWLRRTTYNEAVGALRRQGRQIPTDFEWDVEDTTTPGPDEVVVEDELKRALVRGFNQLSGDCRQLLYLMFHEEGLSYAEMGHILGRAPGALGPTRGRCLEQLAQLIEQAMTTGEER